MAPKLSTACPDCPNNRILLDNTAVYHLFPEYMPCRYPAANPNEQGSFMSQSPNKVICSMNRVSKYRNKEPVIEDISLSYFYGAKIGVLGLNGAGKRDR